MRKIRIEFEVTDEQYEMLKYLERQNINWRQRLIRDYITEGMSMLAWLSSVGMSVLRMHDSNK